MTDYHVPVMLEECLEGLNIKPNGVYVDTTYGGGGHAKAILNKLDDKGVLMVFDQDSDAVKNRIDDPRLIFCEANFRYLENFCTYYRIEKIDGLLADLGVSSHQFNEGDRGFSFRFEGSELDMRMNAEAKISAKDILNNYDQYKLTSLFRQYGELKNAPSVARAVCEYRKLRPIEKVEDLEDAVTSVLNPRQKNKQLAQIYQAVRIEVNGEMEALKDLLNQVPAWIAQGGRLVVMSYHSLEDRLVKNLINHGNVEGKKEVDSFGQWNQCFKAVNRKPIVASEEELAKNNRARSAKLRIAERV
ncbi:MAG: 16S rRNA (cytosine(1402)-N(4))-methyltransferase RsmH [Bacteroidia bacterium]